MDLIKIENISPRLEKQIQRESVLKYAKNRGFLSYKIEKTNVTGFPDVILIRGGQVVFIEVKTTQGKVSPTQEKRMKEIRSKGGMFVVVRGDQQAKLLIDLLDIFVESQP